MATEKTLSTLVINEVESMAVYKYMKENSLINPDELYFVKGEDTKIIVNSSRPSNQSTGEFWYEVT